MRHKVCNFEVYLAWFVLYVFFYKFFKIALWVQFVQSHSHMYFFLSYVYDRVFVKINEDVVAVGGG